MKKDVSKIETALSLCHALRKPPDIDTAWERQAMERIRRVSSGSPAQGAFDLFQRFVWRLAPATGVLAVLLAIAVFRFDPGYTEEFTGALMEDPAAYSVLALYEDDE